MHPVTRSPSLSVSPLHAAVLLLAFSLAGCSTIEDFVGGDKVDYRSQGGKTAGLEVPPDLTQLARDSRYQYPVGGSVSASALQAPASTGLPQAANEVAPSSLGTVSIERQGNQRWLRTSLTPEQLWPQLEAFWKERGFTLVQDQSATGVMETDWAENRAKLPNDIIRNTIGKVFDSAYSTGELDKFRTRVERGTNGTEIYITHRGMVETYVGQRSEATVWQPRPADPQLEGEFLSRLMVKLGARAEVARSAVDAAVPGGPARARLVAGQPAATLQVDDGFDRAWRRVGVALDRSGFTVEDRDRTQGVYFVRYVDPATAGKEEPSFLGKLFSFGSSKDPLAGPARYRVQVKADGATTLVTVQNAQGAPENGEAGKRISTMLLDELK